MIIFFKISIYESIIYAAKTVAQSFVQHNGGIHVVNAKCFSGSIHVHVGTLLRVRRSTGEDMNNQW